MHCSALLAVQHVHVQSICACCCTNTAALQSLIVSSLIKAVMAICLCNGALYLTQQFCHPGKSCFVTHALRAQAPYVCVGCSYKTLWLLWTKIVSKGMQWMHVLMHDWSVGTHLQLKRLILRSIVWLKRQPSACSNLFFTTSKQHCCTLNSFLSVLVSNSKSLNVCCMRCLMCSEVSGSVWCMVLLS